MVNDAEKYKSEDDAQKKKIDARNSLEQYAYSMKNTMRDDKVHPPPPSFPVTQVMDSYTYCTQLLYTPGASRELPGFHLFTEIAFLSDTLRNW